MSEIDGFKVTPRSAFCTKCGCNPRFVVAVAPVRMEIRYRGAGCFEIGKRRLLEDPPIGTLVFECGGGHRWEAKKEPCC